MKLNNSFPALSEKVSFGDPNLGQIGKSIFFLKMKINIFLFWFFWFLESLIIYNINNFQRVLIPILISVEYRYYSQSNLHVHGKLRAVTWHYQ